MDAGDRRPGRWSVLAVLVLIGFTAVIAQIVLMRELMVVFHGNEMSLGWMLASWLLWTAIGSAAIGRLASRIGEAHRVVAILQILAAIALPLSIFLVRSSRNVLQSVPGEVLGPGPMLFTSLLVLSIFCLVSGGLFSAGSLLYAREAGASTAEGTSRMYLVEAVGSGLGGALASLLLIRSCQPFTIALLLSCLNIVAAMWLATQTKRRRRMALFVVTCVMAYAILPLGAPWLERVSLGELWRGYTLIDTRNSIYGNLAVVQTGGTRSLLENGFVAFNAPDRMSAEEAVHFAMLQHAAPKSLLLIGGGANGSLAQALQYPTLERIDYVELDPAVIELSNEYFPEEWAYATADSRVHVHNQDGRLFLKTSEIKFDVVIVNLPDPQTAQVNRFYTAEFFEAVARRLTPKGVFSFQLKGAEDYIGPELADFLRCIQKTLASVFPQTLTIPGDTVHFLAATQAGALTRDPTELVARLRAQRIRTSYVREYYLPFRMMPDRVLDLESQLRAQPSTRVNRDFAPVAYYYDVVLWSTRFGSVYRRLFQGLGRMSFGRFAGGVAIVLFLAALAATWRSTVADRVRTSAGFAVATMGFTLMALELLLLLGFQAIYGYVYQELALLIAGFMAGMAAGSWIASRATRETERGERNRKDILQLAGLQLFAAFSPLLLYFVFGRLGSADTLPGILLASRILFPVLAVLCGTLGGYQFPIASRVFFACGDRRRASPGALYALDLAGACFGALLLSSYLVPTFGFEKTAWIIGMANLAPIVVLRLAGTGQTSEA
ncbi:MAG TPA: fused MFS/spermidine synthase [Candidatus Saccharimonadales bacterium]|nr:fused MFS/spermidine synthase [Candidatus Saccharimonadales bacterium]